MRSLYLISTCLSLQTLLWYCGHATAQPTGFLSFDCGLDTPYLDAHGIQWIPDEGRIQAGEAIRIGDHLNPMLSTMRLFRGNLSKYCYNLTNDLVKKGAFFLIRATFWPGSRSIYVPQSNDGYFHFKYVIDGDEWRDIRFPYTQNSSWFSSEAYVRAQGSSIYYCLARNAPKGDAPFISTLELRPLSPMMSATSFMNYSTFSLSTYRRFRCGSSLSIRYPVDVLDRIWLSPPAMDMVDTITTNAAINTGDSFNMPPPSVLQTGFVGKAVNNSFFTISFDSLDVNKFYLVQFYFAEIDPNVSAEGQRMYNIYLNGELFNTKEPIDIFKKVGPNAGYSRYTGSYPNNDGVLMLNFSATPNSSFPPLLCAMEIFRSSNITSFTLSSSSDVNAIENIKASLNLGDYTGDPCIPAQYGYSWVECTVSLTTLSIPRITSLLLSSYGVIGHIPESISTLTLLNETLLDGNDLEGPIPDFSQSTVLTLNLSNNNLNGSIPETLATLKSLKVLHLQNNNLSGAIPAALLERKKAGTLDFEFFGNQLLCVDNCISSMPSRDSKSKASRIGLIAGVPLVAVLLALGGVFIVRRQTNKNRFSKEASIPSNGQQQDVELSPFQSSNPGFERPQPKMLIQEFKFHQIKVMTSNFATQLGTGRLSNVFKGLLGDGRTVAIKVASHLGEKHLKEFFNEVEILSKVHHTNLVQMLGYCNENILALIYEYMSNGSLFDHLHGNCTKGSALSWTIRLNILIDAAQGILYLHDGCHPSIIHRDIKSSNILLNENMEAKISDFGISREKLSSEPLASTILTMEYTDPDYLSKMRISKEMDIDSFGVLIFEVVCGRKPNLSGSSHEEIHIVNWAKPFIEQGSIEKIVDEALLKDCHAPSLWRVLEIAIACVQLPSSSRPDMGTIYNDLKDANQMVLGSYTE
ncbi:hypothetical protein L7F22_012882 [Adiantum nelumboides]|nr:hypothetical protein [Adiantum nelumboides]